MSRRAGCPQGHFWDIANEHSMPVCPVCGAAAAMLDGETAALAPAEGPEPEADVPPTDLSADQRTVNHLPAVPLAPGASAPAVIAGCEVVRKLGQGGMGVVYLARQAGLSRLVALKVVRTGEFASAEERLRFQGEAKTAAQLRHAGIVQVFAVGEDQGCPFFVMEYVPGGNLADKLKNGPLPPRQAAELVAQLARAVHHAHQAGVVHRDLKPANILLTADGTPKVADFGLARRLGGGRGLTGVRALMGTPGYMAPEQAANAAGVGPEADVYALGAILYACLTGQPPFKGTTAAQTLMLARTQRPQPPGRVRPGVPPALEAVCLRCLEKERGQRYASAEALAEDLERLLAGDLPAPRPWRPRRWLVVSGVLALSLALLVGLLGMIGRPPADPVMKDLVKTIPEKMEAVIRPTPVDPVMADRPEAGIGPPSVDPVVPARSADKGHKDPGGRVGPLPVAVDPQGQGRPGNLDEQLNEQAPRLIEILRDRGVKAVGILRFRVQEGWGPETFDAGPLNGNLPLRIENALVIHLRAFDGLPFGVIRDASRAAAAAGVGRWFSDVAERRKLFEPEYPLAWSRTRVRADAFLTGKVVVPEDLERAKPEVVIELIAAANPEVRKTLMRFPFAPDTPLLRDLGIAYELPGKGRLTPELFLRELQRQRADARRKHEPSPDEPPPAAEAVRVGDLEFKFLRNGKPATIRNDQIGCPAPGEEISFAIANRSPDKRLGVDVRLNGRSLVLEQKIEAEYARVFVLDPGEETVLEGFLTDEKKRTVAPFGVLVGEEARQKQELLGSRAGQIEVTVFKREEDPSAQPVKISRSFRGLRPAEEGEARTSLTALQDRLMAQAALKVRTVEEDGRKRALIEEDRDREKEIEKVLTFNFRKAVSTSAYKTLKIIPR
jgi:serine/threonine protein kinase